MSIGALVRQARKAQGVTQEELARRLNVSQSRVCVIESDRHDCTVATLRGLANALDMDLVVDFIAREGANGSNSRSLGLQPREEIASEQKSEEGRTFEYELRCDEMVETMFQQAPASTFEHDVAALCGL